VAHTAYIGVGSNLGEREAQIRAGLARLPALGLRVEAVSSLIETEPVGAPAGAAQGKYLNGVARLSTELTPREVLEALLATERACGRVRSAGVRNEARTLDLDLLLYDDLVLDEPGLTLPHPRLHEREFVLRPLTELAPGLRHPVLGRTMAELRDGIRA
jgi:2-amino-4-hydroxy-6-hydroxymethyldihydropteridine diphosphokinase